MLGNILLSVFLIFIATVVRIDTSSYGDCSALVAVGPDVFPNIISWFLYAASVAFICPPLYKLLIKKVDKEGQSYYQLEKAKAISAFENIKKNLHSFWGTIGVVLLMVLYGLLLKPVGFEICTLLFIVGVMLCCGERKPLRLVLVPVCTMVGVLLIFKVILKIALPMTIFTNL